VSAHEALSPCPASEFLPGREIHKLAGAVIAGLAKRPLFAKEVVVDFCYLPNLGASGPLNLSAAQCSILLGKPHHHGLQVQEVVRKPADVFLQAGIIGSLGRSRTESNAFVAFPISPKAAFTELSSMRAA